VKVKIDMNCILNPGTTFSCISKIWGCEDFRPPQRNYRSLLAKRDTLVIMPTGGGNLFAFNPAALLQTGLTLVFPAPQWPWMGKNQAELA